MTENLSQTIRNQFSTMRHLYAGSIHEQLRTGDVVDHLYYDGWHTIVATRQDTLGGRRVTAHVSAEGVYLTFPDRDGDSVTIQIAVPYRIGAVAAAIEGLLATGPRPPSAEEDNPCCHHVEIVDRDEIDRVAAQWGFTVPDPSLSTVDSPKDNRYCCGELMAQLDTEVLRYPDSDRVQVTRTYICVLCDGSTRIEVTDLAEAQYIASNWWR
ncbi:MAG TPA: hypothetical protein VFC19_36400 [Candidatus Limnocylindrales bacterium]|nr:hypothetical protein [Candidatus Limnocylindrales bacterium]